ncbi:TonB-dependent siderophore receptor [Campylobacter sp. FMV-PI01]|uniref:TonB-dependent siderophore receptor n=1 Tax=Campylobacter portucalensis TaxID=2608384 RepID=A0A6L5WJJ0_9BACT|nr:TonB-dependent siderophore receptor [Campylobacter portucalensis]MSN95901.1 TonB-dependent siderophore receptor [Campylobacter portucalensis]
MHKLIFLSTICCSYLLSQQYIVNLPTIVVEEMSDYNKAIGYFNYDEASVSRMGHSLKDTPFTIETLNIQRNRNYGTNDLSSILEGTAGIDASYDMRGEGIKLRGFDISANDIYQDGIRLSGQLRRSTANVERVEILKGPASILYGRTNGGGVVNLVSKKANFSPRAVISGRVGSYDKYGTELDVNHILNENFAFRMVGDLEKSRSFRKGIKHKSYMISPSIVYNKDKFTLEAGYTYDKMDRIPDRSPTKFEYDKMGVSHKDGFARRGDFVEDELHLFKVGTSYEFSPKWKTSLNFGYRKSSQDFDHYFAGTFNKTTKLLSQNYAWQETDNDTLSASLLVNGEFDTGFLNHKITLGYDYSKEDRKPYLASANTKNAKKKGLDEKMLMINPYDRSNWLNNTHKLIKPDTHNHHKSSSNSLFFHDLITINENLKTAFGGRFDFYKFISTNKLKEVSTTYNGKNFSPHIGLIYTIFDDHHLYTSYSKSFAPYGGRGYLGVSIGANPDTFSDPEYNEQYEIGIKNDWLDGALSTTLSLFYNEHNNIRYQPDSKNDPYTWAVRGKEESKGVDFSIIGEIYDGLFVRSSIGFMDAKIKEDRQNPELEDEKLKNTSKIQGNIFVRYAPTDIWFTETGITYVGKRYNYSHDRKTHNVSHENDLDAYARVDFMAGYKFNDNLSTTIAVHNLMDKKYWRSTSMPGAGRSFLAKINYEF